MFNHKKYKEKSHDEMERIFRAILPKSGLNVREEQIRLGEKMLDTLLENKIALCDAGVGIGKTYAYLAACVVMREHAFRSGYFSPTDKRSVVISTSSIALQEAVMEEYIPFLSKVLQDAGIIREPLKAVVRKGKEHFVCDNRFALRLEAVRNKSKNELQREALFSLRTHYDMDEVSGLSSFDRRQVCVPKFCPRGCPGRTGCRYQNYLKRAKEPGIFIQICNHNYLLADAIHREENRRPLLTDYRALIIDEAHQLPEAAGQMFGKSVCREDLDELCILLKKEQLHLQASYLKEGFQTLMESMVKLYPFEDERQYIFCQTKESASILQMVDYRIRKVQAKAAGRIPRWLRYRLEETREVLAHFSAQEKRYILYIESDKEGLPVFCAGSRRTAGILKETLWNSRVPVILTSGTLKVGNGFGRIKQALGLEAIKRVQEYEVKSPFQYQQNCLLYLPENLKATRRGSKKETELLAAHIKELVCSTYGHTLVLFTSYSLMGSVCQILRSEIEFPMIEVWRHTQEEITKFKGMGNAVLFAAGSCWEGMDFPGDMVSSLIIAKLPFAVPDPISEAEREQYDTLGEYINSVIVPDMQKKLRQGFGRAIRTEQDTCVVSILDERAAPGGRYHKDVLCALPT